MVPKTESHAMKPGHHPPQNDAGDVPGCGMLHFAAQCSGFLTTVGDIVD